LDDEEFIRSVLDVGGTETAKRLGLSATTVNARARRLLGVSRGPGRPWNMLEPRAQLFAKMWERGDTYAKIARHFGFTLHQAQMVRAKLKLPKRGQTWDGMANPREPRRRQNAIRQLLAKRGPLTAGEIGGILGLPYRGRGGVVPALLMLQRRGQIVGEGPPRRTKRYRVVETQA
jgi:hypothetical protein